LPFDHDSVKHSLSEYVKGGVHTNGIESLWSLIKRAHNGTFHKLSPKHLDRYIQEFAGRKNIRDQDTIEQIASIRRGMEGKRLRYKQLIASNGGLLVRGVNELSLSNYPVVGTPVQHASNSNHWNDPPSFRGRHYRYQLVCEV